MMLTASADAADVRSVAALGVSAYVLKPFQPDVLASRVRRILAAPKTVRRSPGLVGKPASAPPAPIAAPAGDSDSLELDI
jgi:DNA-binding NarL/FixJ family response regulator